MHDSAQYFCYLLGTLCSVTLKGLDFAYTQTNEEDLHKSFHKMDTAHLVKSFTKAQQRLCNSECACCLRMDIYNMHVCRCGVLPCLLCTRSPLVLQECQRHPDAGRWEVRTKKKKREMENISRMISFYFNNHIFIKNFFHKQ